MFSSTMSCPVIAQTSQNSLKIFPRRYLCHSTLETNKLQIIWQFFNKLVINKEIKLLPVKQKKKWNCDNYQSWVKVPIWSTYTLCTTYTSNILVVKSIKDMYLLDHFITNFSKQNRIESFLWIPFAFHNIIFHLKLNRGFNIHCLC